MTRSALYVGHIRHRRAGSPRHSFRYAMWHALLDLDELPQLHRRLRLWSHNRPNLTSFCDRDHLGPERLPVRIKLDRLLASHGAEPADGPVQLLTGLRVLGAGFNPVSFFFCSDRDEALRQVIVEVRNTFGEACAYHLDCRHSGSATVISGEADKVFHVSPFQPVSGRYQFRITTPGPRMTIHIDVLRDGRRVFDATLTSNRRYLSDRTLAATIARHPHHALRTLGLIHWQALRLWLKKAPVISKPTPPPSAWRTRHG